MLSFHIKNIPFLRKQASVKELRRQVGEQQDGHHGRQHADGSDGGLLDVDAIYQSTSWEFDHRRDAEHRLPAQHPQHYPHDAAQDGAVRVGDVEEQDADELRQHEGVGEVGAEQPDHQDAVVQEGERRAGQTHHHHRDPDHPLDLLL